MSVSDQLDFNPPDDAVDWCLAQDPALLVLDDTVTIDLDEYNDLLDAFGHDTALRGRDADGRVVASGTAYLQRHDLMPGSDLLDLARPDRSLLLHCSAWLDLHPQRSGSRALTLLEQTAACGADMGPVDHFLQLCRAGLPVADARGQGWTAAPDMELELRALLMWAYRIKPLDFLPAELFDRRGAYTLIRHGWLDDPSWPAGSARRYDEYLHVLKMWSAYADVDSAVMEMWLVREWHRRHSAARTKYRDDEPPF